MKYKKKTTKFLVVFFKVKSYFNTISPQPTLGPAAPDG